MDMNVLRVQSVVVVVLERVGVIGVLLECICLHWLIFTVSRYFLIKQVPNIFSSSCLVPGEIFTRADTCFVPYGD